MGKFKKPENITVLYLYGEYEAIKKEFETYPHELVDSEIKFHLGEEIKKVYPKFKKPYAVIFYNLEYLKVFESEKIKYSNLMFNQNSIRSKEQLTEIIDDLISKNDDSENPQIPPIKTIIFCTTEPTIKEDEELINQALKDSKNYKYRVKEFVLNYSGELNNQRILLNHYKK